ncbi:MAG: class I SAM-dependent methyltransferase [Anaerolineales bacterium]|uniref:hypothetical protein n=1 Tax=Promineifilum sp. TaxID=2664178 RepID=UPI001E0EDF08|nr:class I SAM-dependent methyltransferase [Anaerolineales bacterium]MCB8934585.1 class I SAM-dependent methyltransferase [Promineifilum sp.]MCO5180896.1 hypothetical protein [Promineifilum sp.]
MRASLSVKDLYPPALAEGEGMGTAYEYYVKRRVLSSFLSTLNPPKTILIAGLPQKYGASLDFMLLATEWGAAVTVVDERQQALDRLQASLATLEKMTGTPRIRPPAAAVLADVDTLASVGGHFDLALSSEVLQRLSAEARVSYVARLRELCGSLALFCPNADNEAHNSRSGLGGLSLEEMRRLLDGGRSAVDYIDMPPFPPGITRSAEQREEATSGRFEAFVMWGLERYAHGERFLPLGIRRRHAHIVYGLSHS